MRNTLIEFLDSIREYIRESGTNLAFDERGSSEFVDIFLPKTPLKIFLLKRKYPIYEECFYRVVVAKDEEGARKIAVDEEDEDNGTSWYNAIVTEEGLYTGNKKEPFILLSYYFC